MFSQRGLKNQAGTRISIANQDERLRIFIFQQSGEASGRCLCCFYQGFGFDLEEAAVALHLAGVSTQQCFLSDAQITRWLCVGKSPLPNFRSILAEIFEDFLPKS